MELLSLFVQKSHITLDINPNTDTNTNRIQIQTPNQIEKVYRNKRNYTEIAGARPACTGTYIASAPP